MKNSKPALYFSAYPLKAIKESSTSEQSPFLKAILAGKTRTLSRVRVSPMLNPYKGTIKPSAQKSKNEKKDVEPGGNEWFNNYE
jgi:hypothetical protein